MTLSAAYIVPHPPLAVPEVGHGEERLIPDTISAYHEVGRRIAEHRPRTIVFISPHTAYFRDWIYVAEGRGISGSLSQFGASNVAFDLTFDTSLYDEIIRCAQQSSLDAGPVPLRKKELDHGLMVPLYFIEAEWPNAHYQVVSLGGSGLPREDLIEFGRCVARCAHDTEDAVVLVVSGDLSHKLKQDGPYGYDPAGPKFDEAFGQIVRSGNPLAFAAIDPKTSEDAAECGLSGFIMLAGALDETGILEKEAFTSELLSLEGPFGVGYGIAAYERCFSHKQ